MTWPEELSTEDLLVRLKENTLAGDFVEGTRSDPDPLTPVWVHDLQGILKLGLEDPISRVFIIRRHDFYVAYTYEEAKDTWKLEDWSSALGTNAGWLP